jgi:hypothetical protein
MLIPAIRTSRRDRHGIFVPLLYTRATLIGLRQQGVSPPASLDAVLKTPALQISLVRGFDYGDAYVSWMQFPAAKPGTAGIGSGIRGATDEGRYGSVHHDGAVYFCRF